MVFFFYGSCHAALFLFFLSFLVGKTFSDLFDPEKLSERTCTPGPVCTTRARGSQAALEEGADPTGAVRPPGPSVGQRVHGPPSRLRRSHETQDPTPTAGGAPRVSPSRVKAGKGTYACRLSEATGPRPHLAEGEEAARLAHYGPQKEGNPATSQLERGNETPDLPG